MLYKKVIYIYLQDRLGPLVRAYSVSGGRGARRADARSGSTTDPRTGQSRAGSTTSQTSTSRSKFALILLFFKKGILSIFFDSTVSEDAGDLPCLGFHKGGCMLRGPVI
jgi:hypothetical protein